MIELIKRDDLVNKAGFDELDQVRITYKRVFLESAMRGEYRCTMDSLLKEIGFDQDYLKVYYDQIVANISSLLKEKGFTINRENNVSWIDWSYTGAYSDHNMHYDINEGNANFYQTLSESINDDTLRKIYIMIQKNQLLKNGKININIADIKMNDTIIQAIKIAGYNISDDLTTLSL